MTNNTSAERADFLDRIRVTLTALVILHHTAIMFGGPGGWYLRSDATSQMEKILFTVFCSIDQAFFMGFFFLLAGYFTPRSYDRKGTIQYGIDRLLRLGVPIVVYGFFIGPMTVALADTAAGGNFFETWLSLIRRGYFNIGPLWFAEALIVFSIAYFCWRIIKSHATQHDTAVPSHISLLVATLITGIGAFLLRLWVPVGDQLFALQIGYFSSYIVLFVSGCTLAHSRWLEHVSGKIARPWGLISCITIPILFACAIAAGVLRGIPFNTDGGWTFPALIYAFWEPFVAWGIILMMLWRFRVAPNPLPQWHILAPRAYTAYIIHPPIVVAFGLLLREVSLPSLLKFAIVGTAAIAVCFYVAKPILSIKGAKRVL